MHLVESSQSFILEIHMSFRSQVLIPFDRSPLNFAGSVGCLFGSLIFQRVRDIFFSSLFLKSLLPGFLYCSPSNAENV